MRREVVVEAVRAKILLIGNLSQEVGKRLQKRRKKEKTLSNLLICPSGNCDRKSRQMVLGFFPFWIFLFWDYIVLRLCYTIRIPLICGLPQICISTCSICSPYSHWLVLVNAVLKGTVLYIEIFDIFFYFFQKTPPGPQDICKNVCQCSRWLCRHGVSKFVDYAGTVSANSLTMQARCRHSQMIVSQHFFYCLLS